MICDWTPNWQWLKQQLCDREPFWKVLVLEFAGHTVQIWINSVIGMKCQQIKNQIYRWEREGGMKIQFLFSISNFSVLLLGKFTYSWVSTSALGCSFRHVKFDFQVCGLCCWHWFHDSTVLSIQIPGFLTTWLTPSEGLLKSPLIPS